MSTVSATSKNRRWLPLWFYQMASAKFFVPFAERLIPYFYVASFILLVIGSAWALAVLPTVHEQGNSMRILFIHVPAAIFSTVFYVSMALLGFIFLVWRIKLAAIIARSTAVIGAIFTALALFTGAVWGKPTWGTWWVWDARLTSELILLFLYLGYLALYAAIDDRQKADQACSLLALIGLINIPIIKFSVYWFNTLHQKSTLFAKGGPAMPGDMLALLLLMIMAFALFAIASILRRTCNSILEEQYMKQLYS